MPTIAQFDGIIIQMFCNDHEPPHFHARYGGAKAIVRLTDGEIIAGELPPTAARPVRQWAWRAMANCGIIDDARVRSSR